MNKVLPKIRKDFKVLLLKLKFRIYYSQLHPVIRVRSASYPHPAKSNIIAKWNKSGGVLRVIQIKRCIQAQIVRPGMLCNNLLHVPGNIEVIIFNKATS